MSVHNDSLWLLEHEARALLTRLVRIKSFALHETSVPAASVSHATRIAIERNLSKSRGELRKRVRVYIDWLQHAQAGGSASVMQAQRRFTFLRLRFNAVLTQFDIFADALTQRSEDETGLWLSGLDVFAADALALPKFYQSPPALCYLDRGAGAAIRRARTRLPGGGNNPVAVIRVPRERMVGSGVASSLVHEVGHQAAALLDLVSSLRAQMKHMGQSDEQNSPWFFWDRWISEIVADLWSVSHIGVGSTTGLMGVVSLPRAFVFRVGTDDPHPIPWLRVKLSCAMGNALYPHSQWRRLDDVWESFYPVRDLAIDKQVLFMRLQAGIPEFVDFLLQHRPRKLRGQSIRSVLPLSERQPKQLSNLYERWLQKPAELYRAKPTQVFAVIGQARFDGLMSPEDESNLVAKLLSHWALQRALTTTACIGSVQQHHAFMAV